LARLGWREHVILTDEGGKGVSFTYIVKDLDPGLGNEILPFGQDDLF
jgi:hypothetical protein